MVTLTEIPMREEILRRVAKAEPVLRENVVWSEEHRRLHDSTVEAMAEAGIFRMRVPKRYGGFECDGATLVEVGAALGRVDGSVAWVAMVNWIPTYLVCMFPDEVQDEVFSTPDVRVCGTNAPKGVMVPVEGGYLLTGRWPFVSGAHHAHWMEAAAVILRDGAEPEPVMTMVPMSDMELVDDWHTTGLRGSGSVTTVATDVFVPAERVIPLEAALAPRTLSSTNATIPIYQTPATLVAAVSGVGLLTGLARAAWDVFFERLPERKIIYTDYASQAEAPLTHLRVGAAAHKIDQAMFHARRIADVVDHKAFSGEGWTVEERVRVRADQGEAARLAKEVADTLQMASGGTSIYRDVPIQRIVRDITSAALHGLVVPDVNTELYGRILCGLEPNTLYL
ncbi:acyl-CoA dehydrogenase [Micromonospora sp. HNM0581]|uniref:acyl-CoA dehydrogenase family protein n=1 Tax=Micromonospora sp. HNM0581 TaxID=2716341 RepID=UPI00146EB3D3|nr:acyl-CoA dehydrogenase family protein [Micromonospora sp. HNM0581]NLU79181.1 acyl-CoA dehydrogenase [Micromonospora sp. HNM0581]